MAEKIDTKLLRKGLELLRENDDVPYASVIIDAGYAYLRLVDNSPPLTETEKKELFKICNRFLA